MAEVQLGFRVIRVPSNPPLVRRQSSTRGREEEDSNRNSLPHDRSNYASSWLGSIGVCVRRHPIERVASICIAIVESRAMGTIFGIFSIIIIINRIECCVEWGKK